MIHRMGHNTWKYICIVQVPEYANNLKFGIIKYIKINCHFAEENKIIKEGIVFKTSPTELLNIYFPMWEGLVQVSDKYASWSALPVKFPAMTYGMTPPGHILSVRDVAARENLFLSLFPENVKVGLAFVLLFCSKSAMIFML